MDMTPNTINDEHAGGFSFVVFDIEILKTFDLVLECNFF